MFKNTYKWMYFPSDTSLNVKKKKKSLSFPIFLQCKEFLPLPFVALLVHVYVKCGCHPAPTWRINAWEMQEGQLPNCNLRLDFRLFLYLCTGGSEVKNPPAMQEMQVQIPGLGRSSGEVNGYPLQYSCLENSMDRGAWWATVHGVAKESDTT